MNHQRPSPLTLTGALALLFAVCCGQAFAQSSGGNYTIRKSAVAGGGGASTNGNIQITGTAGQRAAGTVSDGTDTIAAGFWTGVPCTFTAPGDVITPAALPNGVVSQSYSQTLSGNGSVGPYTFMVTAGALPNGLGLNQSGVLSGTPTGVGTSNFTVTVVDGLGCTATQSFSLTIVCATITLSDLPAATAGSAYSATITATPAGGNYTFALTGTLPPGLSFNNGSLSGTLTVAGVYSFTVTATGFGSCTGSRTYSFTVNCPSVTLSAAALAGGQVGVGYSQTVTAQPAGGNYSYVVTSGALPNGLMLNSTTGAISGTPSQTGTFTFRIMATGFGSCSGFRDYQIIISCSTITVYPASLPGGTIGSAYSQSVSATPAGTYSFNVTSGALPVGLSLNVSSGAITGTPMTSGSFTFTITAATGGCTGARSYTVVISCPAITLGSLAAATAGVSYSGSVSASPSGSYTYSVLTGSLPSGLSLNTSTGVISGLPTVTGTYNFTIKAAASSGCSGTQSYSLVVGCPTISISPNTLPNGTPGTGYSQTLSATPATGSYSFAVSSGSLPTGLSLSATGVLSGAPTANGTFNFTVIATGFGSCASAAKSYSITIGSGGCPTITMPASLPNGALGQPYSQSVAASPSGSYTYSLTGTVPPGVNFYNASALLYGYPTTMGSYTFTITASVTGNGSCSASQSYTVVIGSAFARAGDFDGDGKSDFSVWRGTQSTWIILQSSSGEMQNVPWGAEYAPYNDVAVPADYDGDGKVDVAVFRRGNGHWYIRQSSDGAAVDKFWGVGMDVPVPGDYDGDGKADIAVWRAAEGRWYIQRSSDGQTQIESSAGYTPDNDVSALKDVPVPADYDGDGKTDISVFRQSTGVWYIQQSSDGQAITKQTGTTKLGKLERLGTDVPVPADYDGDGKADIAVWRSSEGRWYIKRSSDKRDQVVDWGAANLGDVPVPADYDGDGKADITIWRASEGSWHVKCSAGGSIITKAHGQPGDRPINARQQ